MLAPPAPGPGQGQRAPQPVAPTRRPSSLCFWTPAWVPSLSFSAGPESHCPGPLPRPPILMIRRVMPLRPELSLWELTWKQDSLLGFCQPEAPDGQFQPALTLSPHSYPSGFCSVPVFCFPRGSGALITNPGLASRQGPPLWALRSLGSAHKPGSSDSLSKHPPPFQSLWASGDPLDAVCCPFLWCTSTPWAQPPVPRGGVCCLSPGILDRLWPLLHPLSDLLGLDPAQLLCCPSCPFSCQGPDPSPQA